MKIMCRWCGGSKHHHKVGNERIIDYYSEHGTVSVIIVRVKIHKIHQ